ncbi:MAG: pyridoxamine 5'-phosphate oxidase family protein [Symbiobacteriaceae bacterium]|nr:pyridoxamine 5'-phosphate oxidase family protein [Symbiobacteriaceae bacterium]
MRRQDRQMDEVDALAFLQQATFGVLSLCDHDTPYGIPLNHFYEEGKLYFHAATAGRKLDIIAQNPKASYVVAECSSIKDSPNGLLCGFGTYFRSVICNGTIQIITDPREKAVIASRLTRHLAQEAAAGMLDVTPQETASIIIMALTIENISGKSNQT